MTGVRAERFVVLNLRLLAAASRSSASCSSPCPTASLDVLDDFGDWLLGEFTPAPETTEQLWLALGFAYMVVITGICLVVQADVVRYRPLLLVLAVGKAASSLAALGFYLFDDDVFAYLLNFLVDGFLVFVALCSGRSPAGSGAPAAPS